MLIQPKKTKQLPKGLPLVWVLNQMKDLPSQLLNSEEKIWAKRQHEVLKKNIVQISRTEGCIYLCFSATDKKTNDDRIEVFRQAGDKIGRKLNDQKVVAANLSGHTKCGAEVLAVCEGMMLGNYQFLRYFSKAATMKHTLSEINVVHESITNEALQRISITTDAVYRCRDLVNEPVKNLDATGLAEAFRAMGEEAGIEVEVLSKSRIEALRMGGLLGVNMGSVDPPTFTIMEYKPSKKVNPKPYVLVGKGVVYDTGGISLKPSASMVDMKCDMAGAATVAAALYAVALAGLPVWVVALMPATDNRPSGNAQVPGDVITMYDGSTVEVLNTDAEGRLILADALAYAKNYKPALVIDMATLTGAAQVAIGKYATVAMQSGADKELELLELCGKRVHERIAEFPFWDDYKELLKSDVADLKNIGGPHAGAITAGKFLEHFTSYPYIHLDIAGPAFMDKRDSYRGLGGTGIGVRLLFEFFTAKAKKKSH